MTALTVLTASITLETYASIGERECVSKRKCSREQLKLEREHAVHTMSVHGRQEFPVSRT